MLVLQETRKSYGKTQALISLDLRLGPGAVHGLVGENGAGKSNLVKILSGTTAPDWGSIALNVTSSSTLRLISHETWVLVQGPFRS